jgi:serine/threonine protein kinase/formylglycine-generating enzyme required for sulfatase activity
MGDVQDPSETEAFRGSAGDLPVFQPRLHPAKFGRYTVVRRLGAGGFGEVLLAHDDELDRPVAIKVPSQARVSSSEDVADFLKEAKIVASLDHPHIVPVYDVGRSEDGQVFVVSKFIEGSDLRTLITKAHPTVREATELVATVAEALHYAHTCGLVHRDVKPGNILVEYSGKPFVADFGLALTDDDFGTGAQILGTPSYMSPEQARGEGHRVDGRSDIFSLGIVFYELLTGRRPFAGDSRTEVVEQVASADPRPPRQINDAIPKELERICLKALSKRAVDRFTTARDMAEDLRAFLRGGTATSQPAIAPVPDDLLDASIRDNRFSPTAARGLESDQRVVKVVPKGLRSFDGADADYFLELLPGPRDQHGLPESIRFWKTLIEKIDADDTFRVGLLYGPSGCGKSSFVKAGLLPRLTSAILPVYVEATPEGTETRVLKGLRTVCADLPTNLSLIDSVAAVRKGRIVRCGQKVLLVLDQFEQWLHARRGLESADLVAALRQCDGEHVQAIVMVRDDFWMAVTRFMREVEVELVQGQNLSAIDLFDTRHARKVLAAFGQAYGTLPNRIDEYTREQSAFLDKAISDLAQGGRVPCLRLALFAEMLKNEAWTSVTLRRVGGIEGVGVTFLEETFSSPRANPKNRLHQKAAQALLQALLPEAGVDIKGKMRSEAELQQISGYGLGSRDFADLIHLLDGELRLVTPSDPVDKGDIRKIRDENGAANASLHDSRLAPDRSSPRYYQLTHDYLVPSLREWLGRKQRETRRGRVEARLAERAAYWCSNPSRRHLLSWYEFLSALVYTRPRFWSAPQRAVIVASARHHSARGLALLGVLLVGALALFELRGRFEARNLQSRLTAAHASEVLGITREMAPYRRWLDPLLIAELSSSLTTGDARKELNARLALLPVDSRQLFPLRDWLLSSEPREFLTIREALRPFSLDLVDDLWRKVDDPEIESARRLRAACALAEFDPADSRYRKAASVIVDTLTREGPLAIGYWIEALRPIRNRLIGPLIEVYKDSGRQEQGRVAASVLADYLAADTGALLRLALEADSNRLAVFVPALKRDPDRLRRMLDQELAQAPRQGATEEELSQIYRREANLAVLMLAAGQGDRVWPLLKTGRDQSLRTFLIHQFGSSRADPLVLIHQLDVSCDDSIRQAVVLALGEYGAEDVPPRERVSLIQKLKGVYRDDPDSGIHSAADWLLQRWGKGEEVEVIDRETASTGPCAGRRWFVNRHHHTMAIVRGPVETTLSDDGVSTTVRIPRTFSLGTKEVTIEQFNLYRRSIHLAEAEAERRAFPAEAISWYDAARYCRWVSEQEGVPSKEMCYPPINQIHEGMTMYPDYLTRKGYRLPTEAEWEYCARDGSMLNPPFGGGERWMSYYVWSVLNSQGHSWPVGQLKPNSRGLFDLLGNVYEWCHGFPTVDVTRAGRLPDDREEANVIQGEGWQRGGAFDSRLRNVHCGYRNPNPRDSRYRPVGFRLARTCESG